MSESKAGLYREAILDHARNPRNSGQVEQPTRRARADNPLCGDELELTVRLAGGALREVKLQARGCAIVQAAASMMSEAIVGLPHGEALALGRAFRDLMQDGRDGNEAVAATPDGPPDALPAALEGLRPLLEVRRHRSRIACALLPWKALERTSGD